MKCRPVGKGNENDFAPEAEKGSRAFRVVLGSLAPVQFQRIKQGAVAVKKLKVMILANDTTYTYNLRNEIIERLASDGHEVVVASQPLLRMG